MSWSQDYSVPSYMELLISLTGKHPEELLEAELAKQGISIVKKGTIILDDGMFDTIKGEKITLSDGRVFEPKLAQRFTENGNYGCDTYQYFLEEENPNVCYTGFDRAEDASDETVISVIDDMTYDANKAYIDDLAHGRDDE